MILQLGSDLHSEMRPDVLAAIPGWRDPAADVLVLAGDIFNFADGFEKFDKIFRAVGTGGWKDVIMVPGNHEYYGYSPWPGTGFIRDAMASRRSGWPTVYYAAEPRAFKVAGRRFVCGTMWYSRNAVDDLGGNSDRGTWFDRKRGRNYQFSDFRNISDLSPFCYEQNSAFQKLANQVVPDDIVVTHHLPSPSSTPAEFAKEPDNCFFVCDQTELILKRQPAAWLHGHTHTPFDYKIGTTRVVTNPLGYRHERALKGYRFATLEV